MSEKLTSEQIKEICELQHKSFICQFLLKNSTGFYTQDNINQMFSDISLRGKLDTYQDKLNELVNEYGSEKVIETFKDKEFVQLPENKFTFDMQRKATNEVIGESLTLEEFFEKYDK